MRRQNKRQVNRRTTLHLENLEARRLLSVFADFDGNGHDDLAIGVPGENNNSGAVNVIYSAAGSSGLTDTGNQLWTQNTPGVPDGSSAGDQFGAALAAGDFDNDGFADLAIGVPGESPGGVLQSGAVNIIYGSASGLATRATDKLWHQDSPRVREINESFDGFGSALAAGDFNNDGFTDLAVGVPGESLGSLGRAGGVAIFYGGAGGISAPGNQNFNLDSPLVPGLPTAGDRFGYALSAGDFNGDGREDLGIGIPGFDPSGVESGGAVCILYGSPSGIVTSGSQLWNQDSPDITGGAELDDEFGFSVSAGDFDGDGRDDLAVGVPREDLGSGTLFFNQGFVHVLFGSAAGITASGSDAFSQSDVGGLDGDIEEFGFALAAGDFSGDGRFDLAIGTPFETDLGLQFSVGQVNVVYGSASGIDTSTGIKIKQEDIGTGDKSESNDTFGQVLGVGNFNGGSRADLVINAPRQDVGAASNAGRVFVLYGAVSGFVNGQAWDQDSAGILGAAESDDFFGLGLDAGAGTAPGGAAGHNRRAALLLDATRSDNAPVAGNGVTPLAPSNPARSQTLCGDFRNVFTARNCHLRETGPRNQTTATLRLGPRQPTRLTPWRLCVFA